MTKPEEQQEAASENGPWIHRLLIAAAERALARQNTSQAFRENVYRNVEEAAGPEPAMELRKRYGDWKAPGRREGSA